MLDKYFYSVREAAVLLGLTVKDLERLIDKGIVACQKTPGGHRKIAKDVLSSVKVDI